MTPIAVVRDGAIRLGSSLLREQAEALSVSDARTSAVTGNVLFTGFSQNGTTDVITVGGTFAATNTTVGLNSEVVFNSTGTTGNPLQFISRCGPLAVGNLNNSSLTLDTAVGAYLGRSVNVRCVATNIEIAVAAPADSAFVLAEARRIFADDIVDVEEVS